MHQNKHFSQLIQYNKFIEFDYRNETKNNEVYGAFGPQPIDLTKLTSGNSPATYIFTGKQDPIVNLDGLKDVI